MNATCGYVTVMRVATANTIMICGKSGTALRGITRDPTRSKKYTVT
jgi:hypothetical protein